MTEKSRDLASPGCSLAHSAFPPAGPERPCKMKAGLDISPLAVQTSHEDSCGNHLPLLLGPAREQQEGNSSYSFTGGTPQLRSSLNRSILCQGDVDSELFLKL